MTDVTVWAGVLSGQHMRQWQLCRQAGHSLLLPSDTLVVDIGERIPKLPPFYDRRRQTDQKKISFYGIRVD